MGHCVGGYASSCINDRCSIWSLRKISDIGQELRIATLEIRTCGDIVQAKARYNKSPSDQYLAIIKDWAEREGLRFVRI